MFKVRFKSKKSGETQIAFSANEPVVISGQSKFTVNTSGLDVYGENEMYKFSVSDGNVTLREIFPSAINENGLLEIAAEINGMPVTAIANNFLTCDENVKTVVIPDSVKDIGAYALLQCRNLKNIFVLSDSVNIDSSAFGWINGEEFDKSLTIHGVKGSNAEIYAQEKGMFFHECSEFHHTAEYILGDVNNDGKVNAIDARKILRVGAQLEKFDDDSLIVVADVNKDGKVNAIDARKVLRVGAQLETF